MIDDTFRRVLQVSAASLRGWTTPQGVERRIEPGDWFTDGETQIKQTPFLNRPFAGRAFAVEAPMRSKLAILALVAALDCLSACAVLRRGCSCGAAKDAQPASTRTLVPLNTK
jgi:hypothetical protein